MTLLSDLSNSFLSGPTRQLDYAIRHVVGMRVFVSRTNAKLEPFDTNIGDIVRRACKDTLGVLLYQLLQLEGHIFAEEVYGGAGRRRSATCSTTPQGRREDVADQVDTLPGGTLGRRI